MRVGIAGGGYWGSKHLRVLDGLPDVDRVVLVDPREERREVLSTSFRGIATAARLEDALDEVDAVVVATPPRTHARVALKAITAGKHVLVEKPMSTSGRDARSLVSAAETAGTVLMVGHTFQHNAAVWKLRDVIRSGELGDLYYLDSARLNLGLYQEDVNVLWDLAPHDISIFNFVLDAAPVAVQAWGSAHANLLEDVATLRLTYAEPEVVAEAHVSWLDPCKVRRVTAVGSRKMAVYNDLSPDEPIRLYDKGVSRLTSTPPQPRADDDSLHAMPLSYRYGGITSPHVPLDEPLMVQDREFVECARTGARPSSDGLDGLHVVEVLEAADLSLAQGREVELTSRPVLVTAGRSEVQG